MCVLCLVPLVAACKRDVDVSALAGTWVETDSHRKLQLDASGDGWGPFGAVNTGCDAQHPCDAGLVCVQQPVKQSDGTNLSTTLCAAPCSLGGSACADGSTCNGEKRVCTTSTPFPAFTLHTSVNAFGELLIAFGDDAKPNDQVIPCGPCTLSDDENHLSCLAESTNVAAFAGCEFDRQSK